MTEWTNREKDHLFKSLDRIADALENLSTEVAQTMGPIADQVARDNDERKEA